MNIEIKQIRYEMMLQTNGTIWTLFNLNVTVRLQPKVQNGGKKIYRDTENLTKKEQRKPFYLKLKSCGWFHNSMAIWLFSKRCVQLSDAIASNYVNVIDCKNQPWHWRVYCTKITLINWIECHSVGKSTKALKKQPSFCLLW